MAIAVATMLVVVLVAYAVLAGADFGAGVWDLLAGGTRRGRPVRDLIDTAIAPVWEANHVWLVVAVVVIWTAFPALSQALFSTLFVPLALAALGIVLRGAGFAFRSQLRDQPFEREGGAAFAISSLITPFFMGTAVGAIAAGEVTTSSRSELSAWTSSTSVLTGLLFVSCAAYLAAVFLTVEAGRKGAHELAAQFFRRALVAGVVTAGLAAATLAVLHGSNPTLVHHLLAGRALPLVVVSVLAGAAVLVMLRRRITTMIRPLAALAVAAVVAGWALAQYPYALPRSLTLDDAVAPTATDATVLLVGGIVLVIVVPSFVLLFTLYRRGVLGEEDDMAASVQSGGRLGST